MIEVLAPAKINLTLEVLGRRADGYHEVRTILQAVSLYDTVRVEPVDEGVAVVCDRPDLDGEANLAYWAALALKKATGYTGGARIQVTKGIPVAAGLGGGSTDAAAALVALNRLWGLGLAREALSNVAASLGSDVPFFLTGGAGLGVGRGEQITPLRPLPPTWFVVFAPDGQRLEKKTAQMYRLLRPEHYSDGSWTAGGRDEVERGSFHDRLAYNVFDFVAEAAYPGFSQSVAIMLRAGAWHVHLAGAGPCLFSVARGREDAARVVDRLRSDGGIAWVVEALPDGVRLT